MGSLSVLYADADEFNRGSVTERLRTVGGFAVFAAATAESATHYARTRDIDCVVVSPPLPDGSAFEVFATVREEHPDAPLLVYSDGDVDDVEAHDDLVVQLVLSDDGIEDLVDAIDTAVRYRTHTAYPLPSDERRRLAALEAYDVGDYDCRSAFDRLTTMATAAVGVPGAFVGLMDADREEFISCRGLPTSGIDREDSICTYTLLADSILEIPDVAADSRFADNEVVTEELDIGAYLGAPLVTESGLTVGTFCLVDHEPRSFTEEDRTLLRHFADEAMEQLEFRRRLAAAGVG